MMMTVQAIVAGTPILGYRSADEVDGRSQ